MSEEITTPAVPLVKSESEEQRRGRLKVFLGMAAGVGKTFRMLLEGHAELQAGHDVVIGLLETHGRAETAQLAEGLPMLPRMRVSYRQTVIEEMDLQAILRRAPEICLIDELAHTNAPGSEHAKRYEDVEEILAAGIDVISTLNVQHLESLNDHITELSGIRVRETIPDAILARAEEVVLIDITPEALLERLRSGKVYPAERIDAALNNFFKVENLAALREVALRQVAEEVGAKRLTTELVGSREESLAADAPRPSASACSRSSSRTRMRSASCAARGARPSAWARSSTSCGCAPRADISLRTKERSLSALRQLASVLGARMLEEESDDVAAAIVDVVSRRGSTYILIGRSRPARGLGRLRVPLPQRLMERLPGVDVRIVADRSSRSSSEKP